MKPLDQKTQKNQNLRLHVSLGFFLTTADSSI